MRIAVIAHIHGNLTSLEAVLSDLAGATVDLLISLGDVAALGPQPHEVTARLRELGCAGVLGNCDRIPPVPLPLGSADRLRWLEIEEWGASQLTVEDLNYLRGLPLTLTQSLGEGATRRCCHASPYSITDGIVVTMPDADLARLLRDCKATVIACGHTHATLVPEIGSPLIAGGRHKGNAHGAQRQHRGWNKCATIIARGLSSSAVPGISGSVANGTTRPL